MNTHNPPYSVARASLIPPAASGEGHAQRTNIWGDGLSERSEHMNQAGLAKHMNQAGLGSAAWGWGAQRGVGERSENINKGGEWVGWRGVWVRIA